MSWIEHGDGVFSRRYESLDLNVGAIVCGDGVCVIDTRAHHNQARELIGHVTEISSLPIKWVINTHHHWDHTFGNGAFPDADIWGHERCAVALADYGQAMLARVKKMAPGHAASFDEVVITPPRFTMQDAVTVTFAGRSVELRHLGRGHTDNDIVVIVPDSGVVFAGDLIENGAPPSYGDAFPLEWPATAAALTDLVTDAVVPGHGAPADRSFAATQAEDIKAVADLARARHSDGMPARQAAAAGGPFPESTMAEAFARAWKHLEE